MKNLPSTFIREPDLPAIFDSTGKHYRITNPITERQVLALATRIIERRLVAGAAITSPADARLFARLKFAEFESEKFGILFLNSKHQMISFQILFHGTIDSAAIHPREVVKAALKVNSAAVIFIHNHPSGNPAASRADIEITKTLKAALCLINVRLLDHLIVGANAVESMAELGMVGID